MTRRSFLGLVGLALATARTDLGASEHKNCASEHGSSAPAEDCAPSGFILATGILTTADHELDEGQFAIGLHPEKAAAVTLHPNNPRLDYVRQLRNESGELVLRKYTP